MASNCMIIKSFDLQFTEFRELFKLKSVLIIFKLKINNAFKMLSEIRFVDPDEKIMN